MLNFWRSHRSYILLFLLAIAVRLLYLFDFQQHYPIPNSLMKDSLHFVYQARQIAAGELLGNQAYFFNGPFYLFFLAAMIKLCGGLNLLAIRFVQLSLGAINALLVARLGERLFNRRAGLLAGVLVALYGPLVFNENNILSLIFMVFFFNWSVLLGQKLLDEQATATSIKKLLAIGVICGVAAQFKPDVFIFFAIAGLWLWRNLRADRRARALAWITAGMVAVIVPITVRNYVVSGDFIPISYNGGIVYYQGNNETATGRFSIPPELNGILVGKYSVAANNDGGDFERQVRAFAEQSAGRQLSPSEISDFWLKKGLAFGWNNSSQQFGLWLKKLYIFLQDYEIPHDYSFYFKKEFCPSLSLPFVTFGLLLPLGLAGVILFWADRRRLALLYLALGAALLSVIIFHMSGRYRLPAICFLAIFAGAGLDWAWTNRREQATRSRLRRAGLAALAALAVSFYHNEDPRSHFAEAYNKVGVVKGVEKDYASAITNFERALQYNPDHRLAYDNLHLARKMLAESAGASSAPMSRPAIAPTPLSR